MKALSVLVVALLILTLGSARASLSVKMDDPKSVDNKTVIKLTMVNTYSNTVESARVALFLVDEKGKVVGQRAEWVIGGTKDKPALPPQGTATYYFNVPTDKAFQKANVIFTRIILEGGEVIQAGKGFQLEK